MQLTFASYNIHKALGMDRKRDPERIMAVLREVDADVIALQEADIRLGERASVIPRALIDDSPWKALPVAKRPRSIGWHGNALFVRKHIECVRTGALDLPTLEPRGAVFAELECDGHKVQVIGTHLDLSGLRRRDQIRAILREFSECESGCPQVVMGDFNQFGRTTGAMREFGEGWAMCATGPSFPSRRAVARLDRILVRGHSGLGHARSHASALAAVASDHLPISAEIAL